MAEVLLHTVSQAPADRVASIMTQASRTYDLLDPSRGKGSMKIPPWILCAFTHWEEVGTIISQGRGMKVFPSEPTEEQDTVIHSCNPSTEKAQTGRLRF